MSRRKADYVYVPKKKIKKIVIDAQKGSKPVEKIVNQKQILDGAYVRAAALKEFRNFNFGQGGSVKNSISVGDVIRENKSGVYYIVYEVKNGAATKMFAIPNNVGEAIAFANDPSQIDWDKYTMYSDQNLNSKFSVGDMVYVEKHRKSGIIISKGSLSNGEMYYTVKFANDTQDSLDDSELELISTYKRGGNIGNYNSGRSWKQDHNRHNKSESYEIPMDDRKFETGGKIAKGNYEMILSQAKEVQHHTNELKNILKNEKEIDAWVVAKMENASSTLSDITHYLDGKTEYAKGGNVERNLPMTDIFVPREKNVTGSKLLFDLQYGDVFRVTAPHQSSGKLFVFIDLVESKYMGRTQIMIKAKPFPTKPNEKYVEIMGLQDGDITILSQEEAGARYMRKQIEQQKFETGGDIPDLSNMNIDHLFANGGRPYPMTEEKIYS